jgi:hypothetical protein
MTGEKTDSVECYCNRTPIGVGWQTHINTLANMRLVVPTFDHLTGVVDNALVIIIITVRKVHAHCSILSGFVADLCYLTHQC